MNSIIAWVGAFLGLAALLYTRKLQGELSTAQRRLDRYNKALFDASDELRKLREQVEGQAAQLKLQMKLSQGNTPFTSEMTVREAQLVHPFAQGLMASAGLGGCSSCAEDRLVDAARDHGVNLSQLLQHLNQLATQTTNNGGSMLVDKMPNVQLELS